MAGVWLQKAGGGERIRGVARSPQGRQNAEMRFLFLLLLLVTVCRLPAQDAPVVETPTPDINAMILAEVARIPEGGKYAANRYAILQLQSTAHFEKGKFFTIPNAPFPSFCSGATYLIFIRVLEDLREMNGLSLEPATLSQLIIRGQADGVGIWGRWNANGPGTARLFHELGIGRNFTDYGAARPGDFMKIFWTEEVGQKERGHSVIYLGRETVDGVEQVKFWSSNIPDGYGTKSVPRTKIAHAIFSRLEKPERLNRISSIPATDPYLGSLLEVRSSIAEAGRKSGI